MFLNIKEMERGRVRFAQTFPPGAIEFWEQALKQDSPLEAEGYADLVDGASGEIRVRGHFRVQMQSVCDRCLEPASLAVESDFDLVYMPVAEMPEGDEVEVAGEALDVGFYEGDGLELADVVREQVLLSIPMQRVCRQDCRGICPICGQNRNQVSCNCSELAVDDRWYALKNI